MNSLQARFTILDHYKTKHVEIGVIICVQLIFRGLYSINYIGRFLFLCIFEAEVYAGSDLAPSKTKLIKVVKTLNRGRQGKLKTFWDAVYRVSQQY